MSTELNNFWGIANRQYREVPQGDSGLLDGNASLVGGFYDSGDNIKFSFPTAYTITLLSWSVIEYHKNYKDIGELDHIKNIIKWGSDYLLKIFIPSNQTSPASSTLLSQVGMADVNCWQRPEDMKQERPVFSCDETASDLAGEIIAALSAASLVFKDDEKYSTNLTKMARELFDIVTKEEPGFVQGTYTMKDGCGAQARQFYNSTGYKDELVWGGTWLFFATRNTTYLRYSTEYVVMAEEEELSVDKGIFYWNNKLPAIVVLLTRLRFFFDLGYPYEESFISSTNNVDSFMCSYLSPVDHKTQGLVEVVQMVLVFPLKTCGVSPCLRQVSYIHGDNPMEMSYMVWFGNNYPKHVHHRGASIPWDSQWRSCVEGNTWLNSEQPNPNELLGAMVRGPDLNDMFLDERDKLWFTAPTISSNVGLVAALVALLDLQYPFSSLNGADLLGIDNFGIFDDIHLINQRRL
ncbi:hypothetical protein L6452_34767 [Arctium lappa]|uniref:Uncharacterized protein n=1 Tax=Arctium lappa TaxID=4217 RepID=A0ACB8YJL8_ARCLA|nr:hypothetical protein L6452_34767 [Arctium lappa]